MDGVRAMTTDKVLHAIAELVHAMRETWDRAGIYAACHALAATQPLDQVAHAAIDAAMDKTARTPGVIATRARHWQPTLRGNEPPPVRDVLAHHEGDPQLARHGATLAREALAMARALEHDDSKRSSPPDPGGRSATTEPPPRDEP